MGDTTPGLRLATLWSSIIATSGLLLHDKLQPARMLRKKKLEYYIIDIRVHINKLNQHLDWKWILVLTGPSLHGKYFSCIDIYDSLENCSIQDISLRYARNSLAHPFFFHQWIFPVMFNRNHEDEILTKIMIAHYFRCLVWAILCIIISYLAWQGAHTKAVSGRDYKPVIKIDYCLSLLYINC